MPPNHEYAMTPGAVGLAFTPGARTVLVETQDVGALDFVIAPARDHVGVFAGGSWILDRDGNGRRNFRDGAWFLDLNGNGQWDGCAIDACFGFGLPGDVPVVGDWTGDGRTKIGVFRDGRWFLDVDGNGQWDGCGVDACVDFGQPGDRGVAGHW